MAPDENDYDFGPDTPITLKVTDVPLPAYVELLAKVASARVGLRGSRVVLLPWGSRRESVVERVYSLPGAEGWGRVAEWLLYSVHPDTWDAAVGAFIAERDGNLIVSQTPEVHRGIAAVLDRIARASDYRTVVFPVTVPADSERTISYVVRYTW